MRDLKIKLYADGANITEMLTAHRGGVIKGFTTNPTLMRKAGISDYEGFARQVLEQITDMPISFEVFSDELDEMERQARKIATWGQNVYVKIPITNTRGVSTAPIIRSLSEDGIKLNVTAIFTPGHVETVADALCAGTPSVISVFAGRIANAGVDPMPLMRQTVQMARKLPHAEVLWASPREALNIIQADECGCHIITITGDILAATKTFGKDLAEFSLDTVKMFHDDATRAGFSL